MGIIPGLPRIPVKNSCQEFLSRIPTQNYLLPISLGRSKVEEREIKIRREKEKGKRTWSGSWSRTWSRIVLEKKEVR